jgi:hypothetical protein
VVEEGMRMARGGSVEQLELFATGTKTRKQDTSSTFADNLSLPVHRWFRYTAGFSAEWVRRLIEQQKAEGRSSVLDPMCGSGTVLLEAESCGVKSVGVEAHPFVARVGKAKLLWRADAKRFLHRAMEVLDKAKSTEATVSGYPDLIHKCYPMPVLAALDALRRAWEQDADGSALSELCWLDLASILRACSPVGTAQWQYVLPAKSKAKVLSPYEAFAGKASMMAQDMLSRQRSVSGPQAVLYQEDARECPSVAEGWADLVITSPPYANNYDYADATRLEMSFFREIGGWGDLQEAVRAYLIRSCTQHVSDLVKDTEGLLAAPPLGPIRKDLSAVCRTLEKERETRGGKKNYHTMIAAYFKDMAQVWRALRRATSQGALVCFVVGDSAPYGVYVPVDQWLGELALAAGFVSYSFEKTRDRNIKWKNRKHRVPLHEGRLWVRG